MTINMVVSSKGPNPGLCSQRSAAPSISMTETIWWEKLSGATVLFFLMGHPTAWLRGNKFEKYRLPGSVNYVYYV